MRIAMTLLCLAFGLSACGEQKAETPKQAAFRDGPAGSTATQSRGAITFEIGGPIEDRVVLRVEQNEPMPADPVAALIAATHCEAAKSGREYERDDDPIIFDHVPDTWSMSLFPVWDDSPSQEIDPRLGLLSVTIIKTPNGATRLVRFYGPNTNNGAGAGQAADQWERKMMSDKGELTAEMLTDPRKPGEFSDCTKPKP